MNSDENYLGNCYFENREKKKIDFISNITVINNFKQQSHAHFKGRIGIDNLERPHKLYFYLCDCNKNYQKELIDMDEEDTNKEFYIRLVINRSDGSHFDREEHLIFEVIIVSFLAYSVLFIYTAFRLHNQKGLNNGHDYPIMAVFAVPGCVLSALAVRLIHTCIYYYNGKGFDFFEIVARCWLHASDTAIVIVLLGLMLGWGTRKVNILDDN